jgi:hypothetical protein
MNTGRRNADRIFSANEIIAELASADVAQHRSLVQAGPGRDFRGFEQLLNRDEGVDQIDQLRARLVRKRSFNLLACFTSQIHVPADVCDIRSDFFTKKRALRILLLYPMELVGDSG